MVGRRILYTLVLVGCFCFCIAYQQWLAWFLLAALLAFPTFSLVMSLEAMLSIKLRLSLPRTVPLGEPTEVTLRHRCAMPAPVWRCRILVERPLTGQRWKLRQTDLLPTEHCGTLMVTVKKARIYDYLGLTGWPIRIRPPFQQVTVRPEPVAVEDLPALSRLSTHQWKPKPGGGFAENHELRLYRPGDSIQQIHWKLSAKTGELIYRQPMEAVRSELLLRLDLSGNQKVLERKLGKLLWLGPMLLRQKQTFQIQALTGDGAKTWFVMDLKSFNIAYEELLAAPFTCEQIPPVISGIPQRQYYIGGDRDEA